MFKVDRASELFYHVDDSCRLVICQEDGKQSRGRWYEDHMLQAQAALDQDAAIAIWISHDGRAGVCRPVGTLPLPVLLHWSEALDRKYQQEGKGGFEE